MYNEVRESKRGVKKSAGRQEIRKRLGVKGGESQNLVKQKEKKSLQKKGGILLFVRQRGRKKA